MQSFHTGPEKVVPHLCDCCEGAITSTILFFTPLHGICFNLDFEALVESILQVAADLWHRKEAKQMVTSNNYFKCFPAMSKLRHFCDKETQGYINLFQILKNANNAG